MINSNNNALIARNADGEVLMFNEDGDWGNHFKEVKEFLDRNGKDAVLDKHGIVPHTDCQHNRCGLFVSLVWPGDHRIIKDSMSRVMIEWKMTYCHKYAWIYQANTATGN